MLISCFDLKKKETAEEAYLKRNTSAEYEMKRIPLHVRHEGQFTHNGDKCREL